MIRKYPVLDILRTGQIIKHIMNVKGLSVREVQEFLALSTPQSIYHWFDGRNLPTIDNLYALSELFQVPVDEMLVGNRDFNYGYHNPMHFRLQLYYDKINKIRVG